MRFSPILTYRFWIIFNFYPGLPHVCLYSGVNNCSFEWSPQVILPFIYVLTALFVTWEWKRGNTVDSLMKDDHIRLQQNKSLLQTNGCNVCMFWSTSIYGLFCVQHIFNLWSEDGQLFWSNEQIIQTRVTQDLHSSIPVLKHGLSLSTSVVCFY